MLLVEVEGTHTLQNTYDSLDIHLGQSYSILVTADQPAQEYYIVASTRFTSQMLTTTAVLHYSNSARTLSGPPPGGPTTQIDWSLEQARSMRYCTNPFIYFHFPSTIALHQGNTAIYRVVSLCLKGNTNPSSFTNELLAGCIWQNYPFSSGESINII